MEGLTSAAAVNGVSTAESDDEGPFFELELERGEDRPRPKRLEEPTTRNVSISPKDLFFKNRVTPIGPTSRQRPQALSPVSTLRSKSPPRLRLSRALGLNRSGSQRAEKTQKADTKHEEPNTKSFGGERKSSSRGGSGNKLFSREFVRKYLKFVRPLYARASSRMQDEQSKLSETASSFSSPLSPAAAPALAPPYFPKRKEAERSKQFRKSRSASATLTAAGASQGAASRRDDSLLMQQDGIQSAIQHCKRSFNSSSTDSARFSRSASYSCEQLPIDLTRKSIEEANLDIIFLQS